MHYLEKYNSIIIQKPRLEIYPDLKNLNAVYISNNKRNKFEGEVAYFVKEKLLKDDMK